MATATAHKWLSNFISSSNCCNILDRHVSNRQQHRQRQHHQQSLYFIYSHRRPMCKGCYLSMNGCVGENGERTRESVRTIETRRLDSVSSAAMAMYSLKMAISELKEDSPFCTSSGIMRVEVPIEERVEAIDWLHSQSHLLLPRCYFSGREQKSCGGNLISVAGVGSAVFFSQPHAFSYWDWISIRR